MSNFQIILLIIFGVFAALAVAFFSGAISLPQKASDTRFGATGTVTMWGTIPSSELRSTIDFFNQQSGGELTIRYVEKRPATYRQDILDAFAFGGAPDLFIISQDLIHLYQDKLVTIPYQWFSDRMFSDSYIQAASIFKTENGLLGFPVLSDPLIMFYNKNTFDSAGIVSPPKYWKDFTSLVPLLTQKNEILEIRKSAVAMGESQNVRHFKEIILAMNLQLGNSVTVRDSARSSFGSVFSGKSYISAKPAEESLKFYMEFSNPLKNVYSWNKSMPDSLSAFISGDLAIYFGFASEIGLIQRMNPNLNFDIALLPQVEGSNANITYANIHALAIPISTTNFQAAYSVAGQFANGSLAAPLSFVSGLSPVRRDLLAPGSSITKFTDVYYQAAIQSRSWVDPDRERTNKIFGDMIENVLSGLKDYPKAISDADTELKSLLAK